MNVPKLRFKEFNDEWIETKIQNVATVVGGGTPSTDEPKYWGNEINWFTPSEIGKTKYVTISNRKISQNGLKNSSAKLLPNGTILLSSRATVGEASILLNEASTNQGFQSLIVNENNCNEFIYYLKYKYKREMLIKSFGSTFLEISKSNVENIKIKIPSKEEQFKIANFLSLLDKKIELQSKKIEDLKLFKLYMENQFIFKDDASYIEYKLRDILIEGNKTPVVDTSKYQKLTIKLNLKGLEFNESQKEMSDKRPFYVRDENELIIGKQNYFNGSIAIVDKKYAGGICSNAIMSFKAKDGFDIKYIYLYLSQKSYMKQREFLANGTGQKELSEKEFLNFSIRIPSDNKVKKIIKNVNCISKKILLEKNKLNKLIELKRGLMQNMFV